MIKTEKDYWDQAKELLGNYRVTYKDNWKFDFISNPESLILHLSKCKFAMRMATKNRSVLELGCEIGVGASVLGEMATSYLGVDTNHANIEIAKNNLFDSKYQFLCDDYLQNKYGVFESIISFDVLDNLESDLKRGFLDSMIQQLSPKGMLVLGCSTHSLENIEEQLSLEFFQVWHFGMTDEIIHTNISECTYHIFLCSHIKNG
jgi:2-polyprenyl-3-methyl-5-hydroxy-6-metoxy-1,4-benzoquinol methylase